MVDARAMMVHKWLVMANAPVQCLLLCCAGAIVRCSVVMAAECVNMLP